MDGLLTTRIKQTTKTFCGTLGSGAASNEDQCCRRQRENPVFFLPGPCGRSVESKTTVMDQDTVKLITGDESDLGNVMIRMTEAQLALQTAVQSKKQVFRSLQ